MIVIIVMIINDLVSSIIIFVSYKIPGPLTSTLLLRIGSKPPSWSTQHESVFKTAENRPRRRLHSPKFINTTVHISSISLSAQVCLSVCLHACMRVCVCACLSVYLPVCLSVIHFQGFLLGLSVSLSVCLSLSVSVCLCLSISLTHCLSLSLSSCLSVCLSLYTYILYILFI